MDRIGRQIVEFVAAWPTVLPDGPVRDATLLHLVDTIACAIAGVESEPGRIAREVAAATGGAATIVGDGRPTSADLAAFANTTMLRTFDWNDGMLAKGGGHPSDMIPAVLAVAEERGASGAEAVSAIALAYEVLGALGDAAANRERGWDQGTFMGVSAAVALGRLLGLDEARLGQAVSLALVPSIPLRVTRTGALSMWKGAATAAAVKHSVFAARLAEAGMTGPDLPFEGKQGLFDQVTGPFDVHLPAFPGGPSVVELSHMKAYPAESHSQSLIGLLLSLRDWVGDTPVEAIEIETYFHAYHEIASDPAKWAPETRETADHSLPYLLAIALEDGAVTLDSFGDERIRRPSTRALMQRITVREDPAFTAAYRPPGETISGVPKCRAAIRLADGRSRTDEVGFPRGHSRNPMTRDDVDAKLASIATGWLEPGHIAEIERTWWSIDEADGVGDAMGLLATIRPRRHLG